MHEIIFYAASALLRGAALFLLIQLLERLPFPALHRQLQSRGLWAVLLLLMVLPLHDVNFPGWTAASQADPAENVAAPSLRSDRAPLPPHRKNRKPFPKLRKSRCRRRSSSRPAAPSGGWPVFTSASPDCWPVTG